MKRSRHLSREERALWEKIAKTTKPMEAEMDIVGPEPAKPNFDFKKRNPDIPQFSVGSDANVARANDTLPGIADRLRAAPLNMDAKSFGRMKRGKLSPEARIDLHGMTAAEAHLELREFILDASASQKRLVLVITGKGRVRDDFDAIPARMGVLRHQVPQWLALPPLRNAVLQVTPAHVRHGGDGAYYVYLRRGR